MHSANGLRRLALLCLVVSKVTVTMDVYRGTVVHCLTPQKMEILEDHLVGVDTAHGGQIVFVEPSHCLEELFKKYSPKVHTLSSSQFLMPGLVDTHIHAPQYKFTGTGYDKTVLDWLDTYTYPTETTFSDVSVARKIYSHVVRRTLKHGTTTASYFATIHLESTKELCRIIGDLGQRALVGKLNMDQECPSHYIEDTQKSVEDTQKFIHFVQDMKNPLIQPVVTPRFAITCSEPLLKALGDLAQEMDVPVQSHLCEQKDEVKHTLELFPMHKTCSSIFHSAGLLTPKTYMAHCLFLEDQDIQLFQDKQVGVAHCPNSNFSVKAGCLDVRRMMELGIKVGLATDISGGYSPSILDAMRLSLHTSKAVWFKKGGDNEYVPLNHHEALYLATVGGAQVLGLDNKIGNFQVGKEFDALIIDTNAPQGDPVFDVFDGDTIEDCISKFLYLGDDRNIVKRFVAGQELLM